MRDGLLIDENLLQGLGAQNVSESGGGEQSRRVLHVGDLVDGLDRIEHSIVDHGVHGHGHRVLGEDLLRRHVERDRAQVDRLNAVHARQNEKQAGTLGSAAQVPAETKYDRSLVLFHDLDANADRERERAYD